LKKKTTVVRCCYKAHRDIEGGLGATGGLEANESSEGEIYDPSEQVSAMK